MHKPSQEVRRLANKFGIQVSRKQIIQDGVYRITTPQGNSYCLKRMPYPPSQIHWIDTTLNRMRKKDRRIHMGWPMPKSRKRQKLFVRLQGQDFPRFMLIPWIKGTYPSPYSIQHMKACGTLLARFHQAGNKIDIPVKGQTRKVGTWTSYLRKEEQTLRAAIRKASRNGFHSRLDGLLQRHGQEVLHMCKLSLRALHTSGYRHACRTNRITLCHGDFGPTNLIRTDHGIYMIDFESLRMDLRAYDLYKAIFNFSQTNHWRFAYTKAFLDGYQKVSPLIRTDYELLRSLLRFPRGICKLIQNYSKKSAKDKRRIIQDFPVILAHERKRSEFLRKLSS